MQVYRLAFLATTVLAMTYMGCNKKEDLAVTEAEATLTTEALISDETSSRVYDDVFDNVMGSDAEAGLGMNIGVFGGREGGTTTTFEPSGARTDSAPPPPQGSPRCFTVTVSPQQPNVYPKTVTLDFGNVGCKGPDGKVRKGKMITVFTGPMRQPQSMATTTFQNFFSDSFQISGTHIITNVSSSNLRSFRTQVVNGKLALSATRFVSWNKDITWLQTEGNGTPALPLDDVFEFTGSASGSQVSGSNNNVWTMQILQPLRRRFTCRFIVAGKRQVTRNTQTGVLDYGNGNCDSLATITINGNTRNIILR